MTNRTSQAVLIALLMGSTSIAAAEHRSKHVREAELRPAMAKLWEDHITWTRLYILSALADADDKSVTTERLLQNQVDIGDAIKPFYGDAAGQKLTALLRQHILTAAEVVAASRVRNPVKLQGKIMDWRRNADEIAGFLSAANPSHWPAAEMKAMMREHLDLTTAQVMARLRKDWRGDVAAYDSVHVQILKMADMLSDGIVGQFPKQFASR